MYQKKYLKYKQKYLDLKKKQLGNATKQVDPQPPNIAPPKLPKPPIDFTRLNYEVKMWELNNEKDILNWNKLIRALLEDQNLARKKARAGDSLQYDNIKNHTLFNVYESSGLDFAHINNPNDTISIRINPIVLVAMEKDFAEGSDITTFYENYLKNGTDMYTRRDGINKIYGFLPMSRHYNDDSDQVKILFPRGLQKLLAGHNAEIKNLFEFFMHTIKKNDKLNKAIIITRFALGGYGVNNLWQSKMTKKWLETFPGRVKIGILDKIKEESWVMPTKDCKNRESNLLSNLEKLEYENYCNYTYGYLNPGKGGLKYECDDTNKNCRLIVYNERGEEILNINEIEGNKLEETPVVNSILNYNNKKKKIPIWQPLGILLTVWPASD
jgi:hypothetical protein